MYNGIDCATKLTAQTAAAIMAAGYSFAGRYLVPNVGDLAWKALTREEAEAITGAGLRLLTVYETAADRARGGASAGAYDGAAACAVARQIGMPEHGIIYFAVDYDAQPAEYRTIAEYLQAARQQSGPYEIGVYGSYGVVQEMAMRGVCRGFWQCLAWSYGKRSPNLTVYQGGYGQTVAGVSVDTNECPNLDAAGIWAYQAAAPEPEAPSFDVAALTDEQCYEIVRRANDYAGALPAPDWAAAELAEATAAGITDGTYPMRLARRYEAAVMTLRAQRRGEDDGR